MLRVELTIDQLVEFAQQGWEYPLTDDPVTRTAIAGWLIERQIPIVQVIPQEDLNELHSLFAVGAKE